MAENMPRMTLATQMVLEFLLTDPTTERYGLDIGFATGLPSGTVHPILARLEGLGWVQSRWEDIDPREQGRPQRRYYLLSATGAESARMAVARAGRSVRRTRLRPGTA